MLILNEEQADILQEDSSDLKKLQRKFLLFSTMQYFNGGQNQSPRFSYTSSSITSRNLKFIISPLVKTSIDFSNEKDILFRAFLGSDEFPPKMNNHSCLFAAPPSVETRLVFPRLFRWPLDPHKYSRSTQIRPELSRSEHFVAGLCTDVKAGSGWNPSCNRNRVLTLDMSYAGWGWGLYRGRGGGRGRNFLRPTKVYGTRH